MNDAYWADAEDLDALPSWAQYQIGYRTIAAAAAKEDKEKILLVQLTYPELAVIPFSLLVTSRIFPELRGIASNLSEKLHDLANAQEFLAGESKED